MSVTPRRSSDGSHCDEEDKGKESRQGSTTPVQAAGRGAILLMVGEDEKDRRKLHRPQCIEMNPDQDNDKLQQQQVGSPAWNPPTPSTTREEHVSTNTGEATPRMLRFFIVVSITWSATIISCLGPYFPLYVKETFDASPMLVGIIFSITSIVQFVTCPLVSLLSRRFSRLATLRAGLFVLAMGALFFGLLGSIPGFVLGRLLQGIGNGFLEVSGLSLLMRFSTDLRRDIGLLEGASSVGYLLGPLIGGFLSAQMGFQLLFVLMTVPIITLLGLLCVKPQWVLPPEESSQGPTWEGSDEDEDEWEELGEEGHGEEEGQAAKGAGSAAEGGADGTPTPRMRRQRTLPLPPSPATAPPPSSPYESFASSTRKLFRALATSPTLPLYISVVLVVAGGLSFMDTALAEHLVRTAGVSNYTAGLLFTLQVDVYIVFAFFAAQLAHKFGEWRTIVTSTAIWSVAMLALGPFPPLAPALASIGGSPQAGGLILSIATLVVLGITETFVFLPFIPLFHRRLRKKLGWAALETEDTVASVWTTTWACGQCLGPLIGGFLLDLLPRTTAFACLAGASNASEEATDGLPTDLRDTEACQSAFAWVVAAWGMVGFLLAFLLVLALLRERLGRAWKRRATRGLPIYSPDTALGELPLPGAAGHEDEYQYEDGEAGREEDLGALAAIGASIPRRPLLGMSSFLATEEYELDRSRRSVDTSRRSDDAGLDVSLRGEFPHFAVERGELDRSRRYRAESWGEEKV